MSTEKAEIRRLMKQRETEFLLSGAAESESARILSEIESLPAFVSSSCVLAYMSIPGEVMTASFLAKWCESKRLVLPRVIGDNLELRLYDPLSLKEGYRGILEPSDQAPIVSPEEIDFALVPGVAFASMPDLYGSIRRWRLGRGKGFYDRLLALLNCKTVGVGYDFRNLDAIPLDYWDKPLDY